MLDKNKSETKGCEIKHQLPRHRGLGAFIIQSLSVIRFLFLVTALLLVLLQQDTNLELHFEIRTTFEIALVSLTLVRLTSVQENVGGKLDAARPTVDALGSIFLIRNLVKLKKYNPKVINQSIAKKH